MGGEKRISEISDQIKLMVIPANKPEDIPSSIWEERGCAVYLEYSARRHHMAPSLKWVQFRSAGVDKRLGHPLFL
jgi:hypothetical protein